jgi:hypothetical protein
MDICSFDPLCVILGDLSPIEYSPMKDMLVGVMGSSRAPCKGGERAQGVEFGC